MLCLAENLVTLLTAMLTCGSLRGKKNTIWKFLGGKIEVGFSRSEVASCWNVPTEDAARAVPSWR
jgi:hypothetical protein